MLYHTFYYMLKPTKTTLRKIEDIFKEMDYTIRYEKGTFNSGYCIVEEIKVVVINRFFDTEGRINCLLDILSTISVIEGSLSPANHTNYKEIKKLEYSPSEKEGITI